MDYNLLINGVYWGYNPLILTFDPNFQTIFIAPRGLKLTFLAATSTLWITEMFSQNLQKHTGFLFFNFLNTGRKHMGVEPKIWETPQIIHLFIGFSIIFTIHFGGFTPIFGNTHIVICGTLKTYLMHIA